METQTEMEPAEVEESVDSEVVPEAVEAEAETAEAEAEAAEPVETVETPKKFIRVLKDLPLLTRKEEVALAQKYRETHDPALARRLVESHLRLVVKIARQCCSRQSLLPDLIQEGCLGLIRAVEKYDPDRGIRLSSYAAWWIRAYIYQYIMANSRMIKVATTFTQRKLFFNLNRECNRLERAGKEVEPKEIAARLGVSEKAVIEMSARLNGREVQFDTTVAVDPPSADECLGGINVPQRPDEEVETRELQGAIRKKLDELVLTLETRERLIFEERLLAEKPITLRELGQKFGISRERARQLEERLKKRLRPVLQTMLGEADDDAARAA
jgi:RNA polymerase sigma-32 factor